MKQLYASVLCAVFGHLKPRCGCTTPYDACPRCGETELGKVRLYK